MTPSSSSSQNPTSVYRWEDSSSLERTEHSCWACTTKANSPKALHSCYGIHSMPCLAYHPTMHAIGAAHRCSACVMGREVHDNRHREIAALVCQYKAEEKSLMESPIRPSGRALRERNVNLQNAALNHEDDDNDRRSHSENDEGDPDRSGIDTASTTTGYSDAGVKLTRAEQRDKKRALKAENSQRKAAKNKARHAISLTSKDVERVNVILHGNDPEPGHTHPLATDHTIEDVIARNRGFVKQIRSHNKALDMTVRAGREENRERKRAKRRLSEGVADIELERVINAILSRLGVNHNVTDSRPLSSRPVNLTISASESKKTAKNQAAIVQKLRVAIREDLEKHGESLRQTYIRAAGFFRYAGKNVFERMTEVARTIDLQTGEEWEKKRKREAVVQLAFEGDQDDNDHDVDDGDDDEEGDA